MQNAQLKMCIGSTKNVSQRLIFFLSLAVSNVRISFGHRSLQQTSRSSLLTFLPSAYQQVFARRYLTLDSQRPKKTCALHFAIVNFDPLFKALSFKVLCY